MARPRTIHDFYGFPQPLFDFQYPAEGSPELAQEVAEVVKPDWVGLDQDQWGLDHGTWSVLAHLYPKADIPVVQLSINALQPLDYHVALWARLTALRERGILLLSSGNVVHNLRLMERDKPTVGTDWQRKVGISCENFGLHRTLGKLASAPPHDASLERRNSGNFLRGIIRISIGVRVQ